MGDIVEVRAVGEFPLLIAVFVLGVNCQHGRHLAVTRDEIFPSSQRKGRLLHDEAVFFQPPIRSVEFPLRRRHAGRLQLRVVFQLASARPRILRLCSINGQRVTELEGEFLEDDGETVVFRLDGEAVRGLLRGPGEYRLGFWTEAVGGLDGVLYEGEATVTLRQFPRQPPRESLLGMPSRRAPSLGTGPVPVTPGPTAPGGS